MTRWLDEQQQQYWRAWIAASTLLPEQLGRDLHDATGLTMADYEILVRLSEAPGRSLRMSDLASHTLASRSRLSHQIDRLESAGLVERRTCADDGRGTNAVMTDQGWSLLVEAAPAHVDSVRARFVDVLTPEEFAALGRACAKVAEHLHDE